MRNEAHRFGITFHRQKRSADFLNSEFDKIKGIGPKSIDKLLKKYKSLERIKKLKYEELKNDFATKRPYGEWLNAERIHLNELQPNKEPHGFNPDTLLSRMQAFGFTSMDECMEHNPFVHYTSESCTL